PTASPIPRVRAIAPAWETARVNAVVQFVALLSPESIRRLAALRVVRFDAAAATLAPAGRVLDVEEARARVIARWGGDLCGLLNAMTRSELVMIAEQLRVETTGKSPALRERLWARGAELERGGAEVAVGLQPRPVLLGGHLVVMAPPRGMAPP